MAYANKTIIVNEDSPIDEGGGGEGRSVNPGWEGRQLGWGGESALVTCSLTSFCFLGFVG